MLNMPEIAVLLDRTRAAMVFVIGAMRAVSAMARVHMKGLAPAQIRTGASGCAQAAFLIV